MSPPRESARGEHEGAPVTPDVAAAPEVTSPPPGAPGPETSGDSTLEPSEAERERDEYLELARRTQADFDNYRKRMAREAAAAESRGRAVLIRRMLPVVDNLERALAAAQPMDRDAAPAHIAEGIRLVSEELAGVLRSAGVESYEPTGERFDPGWHEAVMTRPAHPGEAGFVVEVMERGYRLDGQVLRPARVVVGAEDEHKPSAGKPADGSAKRSGGGKTAEGSAGGAASDSLEG